MSTFSGLNIALTSLFAQQRALDVTGQNIANVNTPGYHRQQVVLAPAAGTIPGPMGQSLLCGGVDVLGLRRADTGYVDLQLRLAASTAGRWTAAQEPLAAVQTILTEPPADDLGGLLDSLWSAWQGLAASPEQLAPRLQVQQAGYRLATALNNRYQQLRTLQDSLYATATTTVAEINTLAQQVADLNAGIVAGQAAGRESSELIDQRQQALERLAQLGGVVAYAPEAKGPIISLGGQPLVQGATAYALEIARGPLGEIQLTWAEDGTPVTVTGGELFGLMAARDQQIPSYLQAMDDIAAALMTAVNAAHDDGAGMHGEVGPFFAGTGAADIRLADAVAADASAIAAGLAGLPADGSVAAAIAGLRDQALVGTQTLNQAAQGLLARIGTEVNQANDQAGIAQAVARQLATQQQSIGGVSLDEEMANMIQYQHAYGAAARVLSTMDDMLGDLIAMME